MINGKKRQLKKKIEQIEKMLDKIKVPVRPNRHYQRWGRVMISPPSYRFRNVALSGAGVELVGMDAREYALKHALEPLRAQYDYIFIDCPPSLELLTLNALCAADQVLIPVQCEYYALEGLSDLMVTLRAVKKRLNPTISIFGVLKEKEKKFLEGDYFFAPSPSMAPNQSCASWRIPSPVGWKASKAV